MWGGEEDVSRRGVCVSSLSGSVIDSQKKKAFYAVESNSQALAKGCFPIRFHLCLVITYKAGRGRCVLNHLSKKQTQSIQGVIPSYPSGLPSGYLPQQSDIRKKDPL